jgi:tetratricopeptide (TPR) repeat protein
MIDEAMEALRHAQILREGKFGQDVLEAVPHLRRAADLFGSALRSQSRAEALVDLGQLLQKCNSHGEAIEPLEEAVRIFRELKMRKEAANAGILAGLSQKALGKPDLAVAYLERALAIHQDGGDMVDIAMAHMTLGSVYLDWHKPAEALGHYNQAMPTLVRFTKRAEIAHANEMIGAAHQQAGDRDAAATAFETSIQMKQDVLGDMRGAAKTIGRFADLERHRGQFDKAISLYKRALSIHKLRGDKTLIAQTLGNIGTVLSQQGDRPNAIKHYQECLEMSEQAGERAAVAQALYNLAGIHLDDGRETQAIGLLERSVGICDELGSQRLAERILAVLGDLHAKAGEAEKADATRKRRADVLGAMGDRPAQLHALDELLSEALIREDWEAAILFEKRIITDCGNLLKPIDVIDRRIRQGSLLGRLNDHPEAVNALSQALIVAENAGDSARLGRVLRYLGQAELQAGASADALAHFTRAIDIYASPTAAREKAIALVGMGNALAQLDRKDEARDAFNQAAVLREQIGDDKGTAIIRKATSTL